MARLSRRWAGPSPLSALLNSLEFNRNPIGHGQTRNLFGFAAPRNTPAARVPPRPATRRLGDREWVDEYRWDRADLQLQHPERPGQHRCRRRAFPVCPPLSLCHPAARLP